MSELAVKQIVLASRPKGLPTRENFRLEEVPMPELPQGGLLLRVLYLSLDPYMRGRMDDRKSYAKPVAHLRRYRHALGEARRADRAGLRQVTGTSVEVRSWHSATFRCGASIRSVWT
jgi:NADPH-dependent curcumin reductase CurA